MAMILPTVSNLGVTGFERVKWTALTVADDIGEARVPGMGSDCSIQVSGTFGAGGHLLVEGSNDGVNFVTLNDAQGSALDFTTAKIEQILEAVYIIRPRVTGGDGTTNLNVTMFMRRNGR